MKGFLYLLPLLLLSCTSTPVPTGDRIVSVSWLNQGPTSYSLVETTLCSKRRSVTLEGLPGYTEKALMLEFPLIQNCRVSVIPVIGKTPLQKQTAWVPRPKRVTPTRDYHLQIRVLPNAPPLLKLEPVPVARQRIEGAGRSFSDF